jgi:hypothetical protein
MGCVDKSQRKENLGRATWKGEWLTFFFYGKSPCVYDTLGEGGCLCPIPLSN